MPARRYASETTVAVERSIAEIQKLVKAAGATNWSHAELDDLEPPRAWVQFKLQTWVLRFTLILPTLADVAYSPGGRYRPAGQRKAALDAEMRRRWRELVLLLKAKLVAIDSGVVTMEQEMLSYVVLANDQTIGEWLPPQLAELQAAVQERGSTPLLPPAVIVEEEAQ